MYLDDNELKSTNIVHISIVIYHDDNLKCVSKPLMHLALF